MAPKLRGAPLRTAIYTACLSAFLFFGYDQGVFSGLLENPHWLNQFKNPVPLSNSHTKRID